ncbi:MAG: bifunctional diaminohydroxyphosphoribosylaminopyrimidine deaminase/5-amino-6-(5-phosphoribosylamino)uracil reductase RibD [Candidatus Firestonebacteria bacterium]
MTTKITVKHMDSAISEAKKGAGYTKTNPLVGCILVKKGKVIAKGHHARYGMEHAESMALKIAGRKAAGATAFVTMEPCVGFYGKKTPPCSERLVEAGVEKVVIGMRDPNPKVSGKGIKFLREHGVKVEESGKEKQCSEINRPYLKCVKKGLPLVVIKAAITLDGNIAAWGGDSKWISSKESRRAVHELRTRHDAVLVGRKTVSADNPELNVRHVKGRDPLRVIVDGGLKISLKTKVAVKGTIIAVSEAVSEKKKAGFIKKGVLFLKVRRKGRGLDLKDLLSKLPALGVSSVLVEGGSGIITSLLKEKLADKIILFVAPKLCGSGVSLTGNLGIRKMNNAIQLKDVKYYLTGVDVVVEGNL